ncbi:hypothetical protein Q5P01_008570 [Channa striata]|uniref:Uncharacterized protein n=1 Tax=Channa striata TaxID=64152 RepID=A0AA88MZL5_CHASR|nr:hypothetical protein Q5P01_008570 [Channa striata]
MESCSTTSGCDKPPGRQLLLLAQPYLSYPLEAKLIWSLTLNNLELIKRGEEERSSPSVHSVFFPAPVRALEGQDNDS